MGIRLLNNKRVKGKISIISIIREDIKGDIDFA